MQLSEKSKASLDSGYAVFYDSSSVARQFASAGGWKIGRHSKMGRSLRLAYDWSVQFDPLDGSVLQADDHPVHQYFPLDAVHVDECYDGSVEIMNSSGLIFLKIYPDTQELPDICLDYLGN